MNRITATATATIDLSGLTGEPPGTYIVREGATLRGTKGPDGSLHLSTFAAEGGGHYAISATLQPGEWVLADEEGR